VARLHEIVGLRDPKEKLNPSPAHANDLSFNRGLAVYHPDARAASTGGN
jgi:hypothetical protein